MQVSPQRGQSQNQLMTPSNFGIGKSVSIEPVTGTPVLTGPTTLGFLGVTQASTRAIAQPNSIVPVAIPSWARSATVPGVPLINAGMYPDRTIFAGPVNDGDLLPATVVPEALEFGLPIVGSLLSEPDATGQALAIIMPLVGFQETADLVIPPTGTRVYPLLDGVPTPIGQDIVPVSPYNILAADGFTVIGAAGLAIDVFVGPDESEEIVLSTTIPGSGIANVAFPMAFPCDQDVEVRLSGGDGQVFFQFEGQIGPDDVLVRVERHEVINAYTDVLAQGGPPPADNGRVILRTPSNMRGIHIWNQDVVAHDYEWRPQVNAAVILNPAGSITFGAGVAGCPFGYVPASPFSSSITAFYTAGTTAPGQDVHWLHRVAEAIDTNALIATVWTITRSRL